MSTTPNGLLTRTPGICGGRIRIDGTRITVHRIATLYKQGQGPDEILGTYPHLRPDQVYAALTYYHANRNEVDADLAADDRLYDELKSRQSEGEAA